MLTQIILPASAVYGLARGFDRMQDVVTAGEKAIAMDIMDEAQVQNAVDQVMNQQGTVDVVINDAGFAVYGPVEEVHRNKPKTRYVAGVFAKPRMFMRKYFGDWIFDRILISQYQ